MKALRIFSILFTLNFILSFAPNGAHAKPAAPAGMAFECTTHMEDKSISIRDGGKKKSTLFFRDGKTEIHCPFERKKVEDKKIGKSRVLGIRYQKTGACSSKVLPPPAQRKQIDLIIEISGGVMTAHFDDRRVQGAAPCELAQFQLKLLGLKE